MNLCEILKKEYGKELKDCTNQEIYAGLLDLVQKKAKEKEEKERKEALVRHVEQIPSSMFFKY